MDQEFYSERDMRRLIPDFEVYLKRAEKIGPDEELVVEWEQRAGEEFRMQRLTVRKIPPRTRWRGLPAPTRLAAWFASRLGFVRQFFSVTLQDITAEAARLRAKVDLEALVTSLASAIDIRDPLTSGHVERVTAYASRLGQHAAAFGLLAPSDLETLYYASILHDIGKIGVPDGILNKPGPLTPHEFEIMKRHTHYGLQMLTRFAGGALRRYAVGVLHHERMNGTGYPYGLRGEEIPAIARIIAVADVWDALTSDRPYRPSFSREKALELLGQMRGSHLDGRLVDIFFDRGLYAQANATQEFAWLDALPEIASVVEAPRATGAPTSPLWYVQASDVRRTGPQMDGGV